MNQALDNLEVEYTYHQHTGDPSVIGGCYGNVSVPCKGSVYAISDGVYYTSDKSWHQQVRCNGCGHTYDHLTGSPLSKNQYVKACNRTTTGIGIACGKTTETIESATIIY